MKEITINNINYEIIENNGDAIDIDLLAEKITDYFDGYDYIVYCSNPKCKYHKHEYIFDMENPSFCLYNVEQEQLERKRYQELKEQVKIWIGQYDKNEFCELMKKGKLSTHNCPVYYKLLKDKPCDHNCINCWGKIYDKLKERI